MSSIEGVSLDIQMLGSFEIRYNDRVLVQDNSKSKQIWTLLEYLLANRNKNIPIEKLIDVLWHESEIHNPIGALKNLVYRTRKMLKDSLGIALEYIKYDRGVYSWNNELKCTIDAEEFEALWREVKESKGRPADKINKLKKAMDFYKGDFLPYSSYKEWTLSYVVHYQKIYMECVHEIIKLLMNEELYEEVEEVCRKALEIDSLEEQVHKMLMQALIKLNRQDKALQHYQYMSELYYRELGIHPSSEFRKLYREMLKTVNHIELDLEVIGQDLQESEAARGAMWCEYEIFKLFYRMRARDILRTGDSIFIALITVTDLQEQIPPAQQLEKVIEELKNTIPSRLRKNDLITRFSGTQLILMLAHVNYEDTERVLMRILSDIGFKFKEEKIRIHTKIQPIEPLNVE